MNSVAFHMLALEAENAEEQQTHHQKVLTRQLRDAANPLELPQSLFEKYYRVSKPAFKYLLEVLTRYLKQTEKQFALSPIAKLTACLRFFAEGGYETGVGNDSDVSVAQSTFSKVLTEVLDLYLRHLCLVTVD